MLTKWISLLTIIAHVSVATATAATTRFQNDVVITGNSTVSGNGSVGGTHTVTGAGSIGGSLAVGTTGAADSKAVLDIQSTTKGLLPPRMTQTQRDAITSPSTGLTVFNTTTNSLNVYNGTAWTSAGGSGQGGINYIQANNGNPDAEINLSGWNLYADAAGTSPVDGTGGSPTLTLSRSLSSPLRNNGSFLLVQPNSTNVQGQGASYDFTIDSADKGHTLTVSFDFNASSTFVTSSGSELSDSDVEVYIYDKTGAVLVPVTPHVITSKGGNNYTFRGTFQANPASTSYRFILHVATTSANSTGWQFQFDNVFVGPSATANALSGPVGEIIATGSTTPPPGFLLCDGSPVSRTQYADLFKAIGTTYGPGDGSTTFNIPNLKGMFPRGQGSQTYGGVTYSATLGQTQNDATKKNGLSLTDPGHIHYKQDSTSASGGSYGGANYAYNNGSGNQAQNPTTNSTTGIVLNGGDAETRPANVGVAYHIRYVASYQLSSDAGNSGPVEFNGSESLSTALSATPLTINVTSINDTAGSYSAGSYTIASSGKYNLLANIPVFFSSAGLATGYWYKNGTALSIGSNQTVGNSITATVIASGVENFVAGDVLTFRVSASSGTGQLSGQVGSLGISKVTGNQTIAASDSVNARYTTSTAQSIADSTNVTILYNSKDYDSGNNFDTTTGKYTVTVPGKYEVQAKVRLALTTLAAGRGSNIFIYKNGSSVSSMYFDYQVGTGSASAGAAHIISDDLNCVVGDQIWIVVSSNNGNTRALDGVAGNNTLTIKRTGN